MGKLSLIWPHISHRIQPLRDSQTGISGISFLLNRSNSMSIFGAYILDDNKGIVNGKKNDFAVI